MKHLQSMALSICCLSLVVGMCAQWNFNRRITRANKNLDKLIVALGDYKLVQSNVVVNCLNLWTNAEQTREWLIMLAQLTAKVEAQCREKHSKDSRQ